MASPRKTSRSDKIFISYRREDAGGFAGRLSDSLADHFGRHRIVRDVTDIDYGHDFEQAIDRRLGESGAVVVLIGSKWSSLTGRDGQRRLDDPADYVGREIVAALQSDVPVVPVLIGYASMPRRDELPERLGALALRNAMTITDERWEFDVARLAKVLAIDVPGSTAQRRLDLLKAIALVLLLASGIYATIVFCSATRALADGKGTLEGAGFTPLASGVAFIAILVAGTAALVGAPWMEDSARKYAWAATAVAYLGTLAAFIAYGTMNGVAAAASLIVNFAASTTLTLVVLGLMLNAGFRAK